MKNLAIRPVPRRQAGVGMIEILVTVFILAIGLLGIAGVQFMSKRASFEATQRTTATLLANNILERMRANSTVLFDYVDNGVPLGGGTITPAPPVPAANAPSAIAAYDLWQWEQALDGVTETIGGVDTGGLLSPSACIYTTALVAGSGQYTVVIAWRGTAKLSDPVNPAATIPSPDPYGCGRALASGIYNSDDTVPVVDAHRRILVVDTYIAQ